MIKAFEKLVSILKENGYEASFKLTEESPNKYSITFKFENMVWEETLTTKTNEELVSCINESCTRLVYQILVSSLVK